MEIALAELSAFASRLVTDINKHKIVVFTAEMGAGKTTLINAICRELGVVDDTSSPTYSIVNEYRTKTDSTIYHFDFYRLNSLEEAYAIGAEDYFFSGNICFIEWPERVLALLPDNYLEIKIEKSANSRLYTLLKVEA